MQGGGGASPIVKYIDITSASSGTWNTARSGNPVVSAKYWDDSEGKYRTLSAASWGIDVNENGNEVGYDFSTGLPFDANDYARIQAIYYTVASNTSNEFDTGWVTVSSINNTLKGATVAGWHEVNLPSGFDRDSPARYGWHPSAKTRHR